MTMAERLTGRQTVPVRIGLSDSSPTQTLVFVVGIADAVRPDLYTRIHEAEKAYRLETSHWPTIVTRIKSRPSDASPRLELGRRIDAVFYELRTLHGIEVINESEALTKLLSLSKSTLYYVRRASRKFTADAVTENKLNWMQVQVLSDIRDPTLVGDGVRLAKMGKLRSQDELRRFRRRANSRHLSPTASK